MVVLLKEQTDEYEELFVKNNFAVYFLPTLKIEYNHQIRERKVELLSAKFEGIILTSFNAVLSLTHSFSPSELEEISQAWRAKRFFIVGNKTKTKLLSLFPALQEEISQIEPQKDSTSLVKEILRIYNASHCREFNLLYMSGDKTAFPFDATKEAERLFIQRLECYKSITSPVDILKFLSSVDHQISEEKGYMCDRLNRMVCVVFFSPSGVDCVLQGINKAHCGDNDRIDETVISDRNIKSQIVNKDESERNNSEIVCKNNNNNNINDAKLEKEVRVFAPRFQFVFSAFGKTTAKRMEESGIIPSIISPSPTASDLCTSILQYVNTHHLDNNNNNDS